MHSTSSKDLAMSIAHSYSSKCSLDAKSFTEGSTSYLGYLQPFWANHLFLYPALSMQDLHQAAVLCAHTKAMPCGCGPWLCTTQRPYTQ